MKKNSIIISLCVAIFGLVISCNNKQVVPYDQEPYFTYIVKFTDEYMKDYIPAFQLNNCSFIDNETGYAMVEQGSYGVTSYNTLEPVIYEMVKKEDVYFELNNGYYLYKVKLLAGDFCNVYPTIFKYKDVDDLEAIYPKDDPVTRFHYITIDEKYIQKDKLFKEVIRVNLDAVDALHSKRGTYRSPEIVASLIEEGDCLSHPQQGAVFTNLNNNELVWCRNASNSNDRIQRNIKDALQDELDVLNELIDAGFPEEYCKKYNLSGK